MSRNTMAYWGATGLFALLFVIGGTGHLLRVDPIAADMAHLGYPAYLMTILGVAKWLGVVAVLVPGRPLLKEWAYAGFAFDLLGASASHLFVGDPLSETLRPVGVLVVGAVSYHLRPESRRIAAAASYNEAGRAAG